MKIGCIRKKKNVVGIIILLKYTVYINAYIHNDEYTNQKRLDTILPTEFSIKTSNYDILLLQKSTHS